MKRRRYFGSTHLFNLLGNRDFVNNVEVDITEEGVETTISTPYEPKRKRVIRGTRADARMIQEAFMTMEQESFRARRQAGEFAVPKCRRRARKSKQPSCDACGGRGGNEDADGNWLACERCG